MAQKNAERWKGTTIFRDQLFVFFSQDITQPLSTAQEQALLKQQELLIVTEGWLGPVIKQSTTLPEMLEYQRWVKNLFVQFLRKVAEFCTDHQRPLPVMCFTIPLYLSLREEEHTIQAALTQVTQELGRHVEALEGAYQRPGQQLARKILLLRAAS